MEYWQLLFDNLLLRDRCDYYIRKDPRNNYSNYLNYPMVSLYFQQNGVIT